MQKMKSLCLKLVTMYLNSDGGFIYEQIRFMSALIPLEYERDVAGFQKMQEEEKRDKVIGEQGSKQDWKCHV